jgi:hypothetical protein
MDDHEYANLLTVVSAVTLHALISQQRYTSHEQLVSLSVDLAQRLIDEVEDEVDKHCG